MPFITKYGGLTTDFDVIPAKRDKDGSILEKGNGLKPLKLAFGSTCDYNPRSPEFRETVWRGTPRTKERHWLDTPVFRVPLEKFSKEDQNRVLSFYLQNQKESTKVIHYEPSLDDIEVKTMGSKKGWELPIHILRVLKSEGVFEKAKREKKVEMPDELKLTEEEYDMIMEALEIRFELSKEKVKEKRIQEVKKIHAEKEGIKVGNVS